MIGEKQHYQILLTPSIPSEACMLGRLVSSGGPTSLDANYRRFGNYGATFELVSDLVHDDLGKGLYLVVLPSLWCCVDSVWLPQRF